MSYAVVYHRKKFQEGHITPTVHINGVHTMTFGSNAAVNLIVIMQLTYFQNKLDRDKSLDNDTYQEKCIFHHLNMETHTQLHVESRNHAI